MILLQKFSLFFWGVVGRDRKMKLHSFDLAYLACDENGDLLDPSQLDTVKDMAKSKLNSAKSLDPRSIPALRSYFTKIENIDGFLMSETMPFSDKNKKYLIG